MQKSDVEALRRACVKMPTTVGLISIAILLNACSAYRERGDPCVLANRDASFSVLLENSILNAYNVCLEEKRNDIIKVWWED
jgi:hypothetical protein